MRLQNRISVITGAGRGIGRSIALAFAQEGARVVLVARSIDQIENVANQVRKGGSEALPIPCDVSSPQEVRQLAKTVQDRFGQVDILVNNAGISKRSKFLEYEDEGWLEVIRVNLFGVYLCTKAFLPMIQSNGKGRIINIASAAGKVPIPFNIAYGVSKHGVLGLTKSLASEVALEGYPGITVNAICPFYVHTDMFTGEKGYVAQISEISGVSREKVIEEAHSANLQKRILEPEEIAALAVYLASDDARGITGQAINVCGGRVFD